MLAQLLCKTGLNSLNWNTKLFVSLMLLLAMATQSTAVVAQTDRLTLIYVSEMTEMDSEEKGSYPKLANFAGELQTDSMNAYPADSQVQMLVDGYIQRLENLLADVIKANADAEIAMVNGGYIRGERQYQIEEQLARRDIMRPFPFRDQVVLVEVSGEQLLLALENGFSQIDAIQRSQPMQL